MATYEIAGKMNLKSIIAESREIAKALNEFADNLEQIEKKYAEPQDMSEQERWLNMRLLNQNKLESEEKDVKNINNNLF